MSPGEVAWRMRSAVRDATDRCFVAMGRQQDRVVRELSEREFGDIPGFRVTDLPVGAWANLEPHRPERRWYQKLREDAERIMAHRLNFFDRQECDLGHPIDWNRDHKSGKAAPMRFSPSIDYRDFDVTGDAKFVWEPNRHHQFVVLARAYRASGNVDYAQAMIDQLSSWIDECPFGVGMNWRSPLELAIRLINWVWAIDLVRESGRIDETFRRRLLECVYLHLWEITRKYSRGSSTNNHLIGEATGVFIATSYFEQLNNASAWQQESLEILCREILEQTRPDGGNCEQALGYQIFVMQFFILAGSVARRIGIDLPREYWDRLEKMFEFVGTLVEGTDAPNFFGDCDDGYVLDLGAKYNDIHAMMPIGVAWFDRSDFKSQAGEFSEPAMWLLGQAGRERFNAIENVWKKRKIESRAFPDSGLYLLQYGRSESNDRISVTFDCGPQGLPPLAAHGHADALSFTLSAFGKKVLIDSGTYDYFSYPQWRDYFRSTAAHNTLTVDAKDQATMLGPFMWGPCPTTKCLLWQGDSSGGTVSGLHDGYASLEDPVLHRRTLTLDGPVGELSICDEIFCQKSHTIHLYFHLAEDIRIVRSLRNCHRIDTGNGLIEIELDPRLTVELFFGREHPIGGWVSSGYHRKSPAITMVACSVFSGITKLESKIRIIKKRVPNYKKLKSEYQL
jgi:hypothetical protein